MEIQENTRVFKLKPALKWFTQQPNILYTFTAVYSEKKPPLMEWILN
jgi:hypothetical protein